MKNKYKDILSQVNNDQRGVSDSILIVDGLNVPTVNVPKFAVEADILEDA
jgi:hypothetical protein